MQEAQTLGSTLQGRLNRGSLHARYMRLHASLQASSDEDPIDRIEEADATQRDQDDGLLCRSSPISAFLDQILTTLEDAPHEAAGITQKQRMRASALFLSEAPAASAEARSSRRAASASEAPPHLPMLKSPPRCKRCKDRCENDEGNLYKMSKVRADFFDAKDELIYTTHTS